MATDEPQQPARRRRSDAYYQAAANGGDITPEALRKNPALQDPRKADSRERPAVQRKIVQDNAMLTNRTPTGEIPKQNTGTRSAAKGSRPTGKTQQTPRPQVGTVGAQGYQPQQSGAFQPYAVPPQYSGQYSSQFTGQQSAQQRRITTPMAQFSGQRAAPQQVSGQAYPVQPSGQAYPVQPSGQAYPAQYSGQNYPAQPSGQAYAPYPMQPSGSMNGPSAAYQPYSNQFGRQGVPPMAPPPPSKRGNGENQRDGRKRSFIPLILLLIVVIIGAIFVGLYLRNQAEQQQARIALENSVTSYDNVFCSNVYVDGISLAGMTREQARQQLLTHAQQENSNWYVNLTLNGEVVQRLTSADLNITFNVDDALNEAWAQGHTGTIDERYAAMNTLMLQPYRGYTAQPNTDTSNVDTILTSLQNSLYRAPQDAYLASFTPGATNPFQIQEEVPGVTLDIGPLRQKIYSMISAGTVGNLELEPSAIHANVTAADIRKTVTLRGTAYTEISTTSTENRNNNIRRAFEKISGTVIRPGKGFSFNNLVGERSYANGFYDAPEVVYNELTDGIGGGVCQASSTIYQAAVRAGMKITERIPHSEKANYADYGLDATVYWAYGHKKDFCFINSSDSDIYIVCSVQSNPSNRKRLIAKVDIYGKDLGNKQYDLVNEFVEELPYKTETRRDKDSKFVSYKDETYTYSAGRDGYIYNSYRITLVDGKETERVLLYKDTYKPKDEIIYVGIRDR